MSLRTQYTKPHHVTHHSSQESDSEVITYCPGNGTRYVVVATDITDPQSAAELGTTAPATVFTFPLMGKCLILDWTDDEPVFAWYVAEKLRCSEADANAITALLADWLHTEAVLADLSEAC